MSVFTGLLTLEVTGSVLYGGFSEFDSRDFTKSALCALISVFLSLSLPFFIFIKQISSVSGLPSVLLCIMALQIAAEAVCSLYCTKERYFYAYRRVFAINLIPALLSPVFALILTPSLRGYARPAGSAAASVLCASAVLLLLFKMRGRADPKMIKHVLKSGISMLPFALSAVLLANADKLMIARRFGSAALAKYSVAHSLGLVLTFATVGLYGALKPWIIRKLSKKEFGSVKKTVGSLFSLFCLLTAAICALAPEIFSFLAPKEYRDALGEVYVLSLAVLPMFLSNMFSSVLMYFNRSLIFSFATLGAALLNIGLNALLFTRFSYSAAAFSFLISYSILALVLWFSLGSEKILGKRTLLTLFLTALAVTAMYRLRFNLPARGALFALLLPAVAFSGFRVLSLVKEK